MEKFTIARRGYDPEEVNRFFDSILQKMETLVKESNQKNLYIAKLQQQLESGQTPQVENLLQENKVLRERLSHIEQLEQTLNRAILMAQKTADQMRSNASEQCEILIDDAKKNASRIVNEALLQAEQTQKENDLLRRNLNIFKKRVKDIIETQLEVVNDIDKIEL